MALTRPKLWDIDTSSTMFNDPITVLHQGATIANIDVGFLFNRANGLVSNVALYWNETNQSFMAVYTSSDGVPNSNIAVTSYANVTVGNITANAFYWGNGAPFIGGSGGGGGTGITYTASATAPASGNSGDQWYNTTTDILYEYTYDGTNYYWIDTSSPPGFVAMMGNAYPTVQVTGTTSSTSTTTGALQVAGGAGIQGNVYAGKVYTTGIYWAGNSNPLPFTTSTGSIDLGTIP